MKTVRHNKPKIIAVVGPTASGKTALSIVLAKKYNGEVISADSRQVYRGLEIGSGKVTKKEMDGIPHHLLDVADPKKIFTVSDFKKLAEGKIKDIVRRGKTPIIVGGAGLYVDTLLNDMQIPKVTPNYSLRKKLEAQTTEVLYGLLEKKDPDRARTIDKHNRVRLIRALEIVEAIGKVPPLSKNLKYDVLYIGLTAENIRNNIKKRLRSRMTKGMVEEVQQLHENGLSFKRLEQFGLEYRYIAQYLQNKMTKEEMLSILETRIVQYAKRQMTWFKRNKSIQWFTLSEVEGLTLEQTEEIYEKVETFLKNLEYVIFDF